MLPEELTRLCDSSTITLPVQQSRLCSSARCTKTLCAPGDLSEENVSVPRALQQHEKRENPYHLQAGCLAKLSRGCPLQAANARGIPVFNAPFSNTRSVAELVICEVIALARQLGDRSAELHQ